jgi:hypothetical protein
MGSGLGEGEWRPHGGASEADAARYVLFSALCPLIPLPFVDDWALREVRRAYFARILGDAPSALLAARTLSEARGSFFPGCLWILVFYPIKKLFRTLFYFLTVKQCLDEAAVTLVQGEMVREALGEGRLPMEAGPARDVMDAVLREESASPVGRWLRLATVGARRPGGGLLGFLRGRAGEAVLVPKFSERLTARLAAPQRDLSAPPPPVDPTV